MDYAVDVVGDMVAGSSNLTTASIIPRSLPRRSDPRAGRSPHAEGACYRVPNGVLLQ